MTAEQLSDERVRLARMGLPVDDASDEDVRAGLILLTEQFHDNAPLTAAQAATAILDGVRRGDWRILVGEDARLYDVAIREDPVAAYDPSFVETMATRGAGISIVR